MLIEQKNVGDYIFGDEFIFYTFLFSGGTTQKKYAIIVEIGVIGAGFIS